MSARTRWGAIICDRCRATFPGHGPWNVTMKRGLPIGYLCPGCQSPEENTEAEIHEATLEYGVSVFGHAVGRPRGGNQ